MTWNRLDAELADTLEAEQARRERDIAYVRARNRAHRAWAESQPQYVIPGLLAQVDEPEFSERGNSPTPEHAATPNREPAFAEPRLNPGAEPRYGTPERTTAAVAPPVHVGASSGGSAPTCPAEEVATARLLGGRVHRPAQASAGREYDRPARMSLEDVRGRGDWRASLDG